MSWLQQTKEKNQSQSSSHLLFLVLALLLAITNATSSKKVEYDVYPKRQSNEAAMIEWGHSAILQAIDAVVAKFGVQTSDGAFFEVESSVVLGSPINGDVRDVPNVEGARKDKILENAKEVFGNMVILTNSNNDKLSDVELAYLAQNSGAAALMVVNTKNSENGDDTNSDYIYSMEATSPEDEVLAAEITIPVIMVSLMSANQLTSASEEEGDVDEQGNPTAVLPDRIRLYSSHDRPFFEDVTSSSNEGNPVVYIIHNLLTDKECDALIENADGKTDVVDGKIASLLEGVDKRGDSHKVDGVESVFLWQGSVLRGHLGKEIDDRIEHSTGFVRENMSDFNIFKHTQGSSYGAHYDVLPTKANVQLATITLFLNDYHHSESPTHNMGGEIIYPRANPPIQIRPKKGMAIVHHNVQNPENEQEDQTDLNSLHGELKYNGLEAKWIAKRYFYKYPLSPTKRILLPFLAFPFGGKLPKKLVTVHDFILGKFEDVDRGSMIFDYLVMGVCGICILFVGALISIVILRSSANSIEGSTADSVAVKKKKKKNSKMKEEKKD